MILRRTTCWLLLAVLATMMSGSTGIASAATDFSPRTAEADAAHVVCRIADDRLVEISGITWSRRHPGTYWVHNDSGGGPYLYAIDGATCRTKARIRVAGIGARDIEAVATGVDPAGRPVLWVGDIGDNRDSWPSVRLVAVREPATLVDQEVGSTTYRFTYPDGGDDAESILADPSSAQVWVVSKSLALGTVYRVPLSTTRVTTAVRVADVGGLSSDAAMAPDGRSFVIRDYLVARLYDAPVRRSTFERPTRITLPLQRQGEAITFTGDGTALLVASEGERELWQVALPSAGTPAPSASPSTTASPSGSVAPAEPSPMPSAGGPVGGDTSGTPPWKLGLAGLAITAAVIAAVSAARRFRT